jgi:hypothetical protein
LACLPAEFQTAGDASGIVDVDDGKAGGVEGLQTAEHVFECHSAHFFADGGVDGRKWGESADKRVEIKSAPADNDGDFFPRGDIADDFQSARSESCGVHVLGAGHRAEKMMRDEGLFAGGGLRTEHGELAIKLKGVSADDFAGEFFGESEGEIGFTDGGRAGEEDGLAEDGAVGHGEQS